MSEDNNVLLRLVELSKVYRDFWGRERVKALDGLNLDVRKGEVFGLLGPNGSGKTTTVRLMLGLLFPTWGAVSLFGKSPRNVDVKRRVGYMPEESHLYEYLNAEETLDFYGRLFRLSGPERRERAEALIEMVGLNRARRRPVKEFSKGMARRLALAQSLINDPDLLILDEPTTGLDPLGAREIKDLILMLKGRGKTVFLCSHLLADVEEICDRICILYGGKQRSEGSVAELLTNVQMTQISTRRLPESTLNRVKEVIRDECGDDALIEVGAPSQRLEELFLSVIKEAQRERLATAGAEVGQRPAAFLSGEEEGKKLLEELVAAAETPERTQEGGPADALHTRADEEFLEQLVQTGPGAAGAASKQKTADPEAPLDTQVHHDVIEELTTGSDSDQENSAQGGTSDEGKDH